MDAMRTSEAPHAASEALLKGTLLAFALIVMGLWNCGCSRSRLEVPHLSDEIFALAAANRIPIELVVAAPHEEQRVGTQFALLALPLGSVYIPEPQQQLWRMAYDALAQAGYRPVPSGAGTTPTRTQRLTVEQPEIRLSVYDYLVQRKIVCSLSVTARVTRDDGSEIFAERLGHTEGELSDFGFTPDVSRVFVKTGDALFRTLLQRAFGRPNEAGR